MQGGFSYTARCKEVQPSFSAGLAKVKVRPRFVSSRRPTTTALAASMASSMVCRPGFDPPPGGWPVRFNRRAVPLP